MKNYWITALLSLALTSFGQQPENNELECDCPSCKDKVTSGQEFTLPGLQDLKDGSRQQETRDDHTEEDDHVHEHTDHEGHDDESHHAEEQASGAVPHDHDGDGVPDHDSHEPDGEPDHGSHEDHDHGEGMVEGIDLSDELIAKVGLNVLVAQGGTVSRSSTFPAEIKLNRDHTAAVSPRYPSIVRQVFAEIGDEVKKGDVLASLENRETMAVYTLSAPQDGIIISKDLAIGETAGDDKVLYEVADLSTVWADISIFPQYQHLVRKGMPVTFVAHDGHTAKGTVKYISPIVSHETRTFTARCVLEGADEDFTPGAFVRARIIIEQVDAQVVVPREAIQIIEGESVVFTQSDHGFFATPVETGLADDLSVEIRKGLKPDDRYVAAGAFVLKAKIVTSGIDPHAGHGH